MAKSTEKNPALEPLAMAKHYGITVSDHSGEGQSIAIISLGGQLQKSEVMADLAAIGAQINQDNLELKNIDPKALEPGGSSGETHLDLQVIGSICPAAKVTIYRAPNDWITGFTPAMNQAVEDGNKVISVSWGQSEADSFVNSPFSRCFVEAVKNSVTVTIASGDGGSANQRNLDQAVGAPDGKAHVQMPAISPWVLACGGTELMSDGTEHVWNNAKTLGGATGGGVSEFVDRPAYQQKIGIVSANSKHVGRIIPDVSALGSFTSWKTATSDGAGIYPTGGTSAVAPLWASICVLVNQKRAVAGKGPLGFFNDHLYTLAAENPGLLYDVTEGDNRPTPEYPGYSAGPGFDACSGWGSPRNGDHLIQVLAGLPDRSPAWFDAVA